MMLYRLFFIPVYNVPILLSSFTVYYDYYMRLHASCSQKKGFTILELMIVVAIIGVLSSTVLASVNIARDKARTTTTISQLKQIATALEFYAEDHNGEYPNPASYGETAPWCNWDVGGEPNAHFAPEMQGADTDGDDDGIEFLDPLLEEGYISKANYKDIMDNDVSLVYGHGDQSPYGQGPCTCVAAGNIEYVIFAYNLRPISGLTDEDECDAAGVIQSHCRPPGNITLPVEDTYCIIKHK
jgi:prepilin-type N-terminal cleavage/methylation domain-containing protein